MSATDRELLELAAKAAGIDYHIDYCDGVAKLVSDGRIWNPLIDDGDALRLAVKLHLGMELYGAGASVKGCHELANGDPYAATRRAIVRAAAEIGRSL